MALLGCSSASLTPPALATLLLSFLQAQRRDRALLSSAREEPDSPIPVKDRSTMKQGQELLRGHSPAAAGLSSLVATNNRMRN